MRVASRDTARHPRGCRGRKSGLAVPVFDCPELPCLGTAGSVIAACKPDNTCTYQMSPTSATRCFTNGVTIQQTSCADASDGLEGFLRFFALRFPHGRRLRFLNEVLDAETFAHPLFHEARNAAHDAGELVSCRLLLPSHLANVHFSL